MPLTKACTSFPVAGVARVRWTADCEILTVQLLTVDGRPACLQRSRDENLGRTLDRLLASSTPKAKKRLKGAPAASAAPPAPTATALLRQPNGEVVSRDTPSSKAFVSGQALEIAGYDAYSVIVNNPFITSIQLPTIVTATLPFAPYVKTDFCRVDECHFAWFRDDNKPLGNSPVYVPTVDDIGHRVRVECAPPGELAVVAESVDVVEPFWTRATMLCDLRDWTPSGPVPSSSGNGLRVMSYNVLADTYASTDYASKVLYPHCAPALLNLWRRHHQVCKEVRLYDPDVVCFQEVMLHQFSECLEPQLNACGFDGLMASKACQVREGCATFFRRSRFEFVSSERVALNEALTARLAVEQQQSGVNDAWATDLCGRLVGLNERMQRLSTVVQLTVLRERTSQRLVCVANTHLFFHWRASGERLIQTKLICEALERLNARHDGALSVILCGDLNSSEETAAVALLDTGVVAHDHPCWEMLAHPRSDDEPVHVSQEDETAVREQHEKDTAHLAPFMGVTVSHSLRLTSAYKDAPPPYTNFVPNFVATLDWIFISERAFRVAAVLNVPQREHIEAHVALPSAVAPSDHIPLCVDLVFQ